MNDVELRTAWKQLGPSLGALAAEGQLSVPQIRQLVETYGWAAAKWAGTELRGRDAARMLNELGAGEIAQNVAKSGRSPTEVRALINAHGLDAVRALFQVSPHAAEKFFGALGNETAAGVAAYRIQNREPARLGDHGARIEAALAPGGALDHVQPLDARSVVIDSNYARNLIEARRKQAAGEPIPAGEQRVLDDYNRRIAAGENVRIPAVTVAEVAVDPNAAHRGFAIGVDRNSVEYRDLLTRLAGHNVGGAHVNGAAADRSIAADMFFSKDARTNPPPTLITADAALMSGLVHMEIARRMAETPGLTPDRARRQLLDPNNTVDRSRTPDVYTNPNGFTVTDATTGRSVHIQPI
jgi:hypothetical protein